MSRYYRIHSASEDIATVLDPSRPDGWVASDEDYETQPHGVSVCASLDDLARYCEMYLLAPQLGDRLLAVRGELSDEQDRDQYAERIVAESVEIIGDAHAWWEASRVDADDVAESLDCCDTDDERAEVWDELDLTAPVREWVERRIRGEWS